MRNRILTLFACALVGTLAASTAVLAQKGGGGGQPAPNPRIQVTFTDAYGDRIVSDRNGPYTDCDGDMTPADCAGLGQIWAGGSEDATFRMAAESPRRFHAYCGAATSGTPVCQEGALYSADGWFLNIVGIGTMPVSATPVDREAVFSVDGDQGGSLPESSLPNKRFRWMGTTAQRVAVTRVSSSRWVVSAPVSSGTAVGANALLDQQARKGYTLVGTYQMPLTSLAIECIKYCDRLTVQ